MVYSSSIAEVVVGSFWIEKKSRIGSYEAIIEPGYCKLDDSRWSKLRECTEEYDIYNHLCW